MFKGTRTPSVWYRKVSLKTLSSVGMLRLHVTELDETREESNSQDHDRQSAQVQSKETAVCGV